MQYSLRVGIYYDATPWVNVSFVDGFIRPKKIAPRDYNREVLEENPRFWKEVQQLSFAFQNGDKVKIRNFYHEYGPILASPSDTEEEFSQVAIMLEWFRRVTMMTEYIEERKARVLLRQMRPREQWVTDSPFPIVVFYAPAAPLPDGKPSWPGIWNYLAAPLKTLTEEELYGTAWSAVMRSFWQYFRKAFQPTQNFRDDHSRNMGFVPDPNPGMWRSNVPSALSAAVYQWYFQVLAEKLSEGTGVICSADDCERIVPHRRLKYVPPNRRPYCSNRCRERQKKRDEQQKKRHKED